MHIAEYFVGVQFAQFTNLTQPVNTMGLSNGNVKVETFSDVDDK